MKQETLKNRTIFCHDNIDILKGINSNSVDLIYLDPPFNKNDTFIAKQNKNIEKIKNFFIKEQKQNNLFLDENFDEIFKDNTASFSDIWTENDINELYYIEEIGKYNNGLMTYLDSIKDFAVKGGYYYLLYMTIRLIEIKRILKDTGSIYYHCDPTFSHYIKAVLDSIFGVENYRNEIVWQRNDGRGKGSQFESKKFGSNTDIIFFYTKSNKFYLKNTRELSNQEILKKFNQKDEQGKKFYTGIPIFRSKSMGDRPNLCYEWKGFKNPHPSGWRLSKERLEEEYQKGNIVITKDGKLERRKYLNDYQGEPLDNNWVDIPRAIGKESTGYPTQKPLALLQRIIKASSNEGDVVLDPFCGCATTCIAAETLGRKWIGIDWNKQSFYMIYYRAFGINLEGREYGRSIATHLTLREDIPGRTDITSQGLAKIEAEYQNKEKIKKIVGIIGGTGGMGKLFARIFRQQGYSVLISSRRTELKPEDCARKSDLLIIAVSISVTEKIIKKCAPLVKPKGAILDLTSLKVFPTQLMLNHSQCEVIGCHPVFGPSIKNLTGQVIVLTPCRGDIWLSRIKKDFKDQSALIKISTPKHHDEIMAVVQGLMHFTTITLANAIRKLNIDPVELMAFSSPVYRIRMDFANRILNQDPELYADIELLNEFFLKALKSYETETKNLADQVRKKNRRGFINSFKKASEYLGKEKIFAEKRTDKIIEFVSKLSN